MQNKFYVEYHVRFFPWKKARCPVHYFVCQLCVQSGEFCPTSSPKRFVCRMLECAVLSNLKDIAQIVVKDDLHEIWIKWSKGML